MGTIHTTVDNHLCISCGVCKAICPKACISWEKEGGMYLPRIDERLCVNCGLCESVCPGIGHRYETKETAQATVTGEVLQCFNAWSRNPELRHVSASGGVVSTLIRELLQKGSYDGAFCLDSFDYRDQLKTRLYTARDFAEPETTNAPKSRYLPVSHEHAVTYMKENPEALLIFVATPCAVRALQNAAKKLKRRREQDLYIGLICDRVFNYNVLPYFVDYYGGKEITALHFKNKESGGWPGDMKFYPAQGSPFYVPLEERGKAKAYFAVERCLYCVDKLNISADICLGDNYTQQDSSELGSNSVIIRTSAGLQAWEQATDGLEMHSVALEQIQKAQDVPWRLNNLCYADLKAMKTGIDLNAGVPREQRAMDYERSWHEHLKKLRCGICYDTAPEKLCKLQKQESKPANTVSVFIRRAYYYLRRKMK